MPNVGFCPKRVIRKRSAWGWAVAAVRPEADARSRRFFRVWRSPVSGVSRRYPRKEGI